MRFFGIALLSLAFVLGIAFAVVYIQNLSSKPDITTLESDAAFGNAEAQYQLALRYQDGTGTPQNLPKAIELFTKAAEQNHAKALHSLGFLYLKGIGVAVDYKKALIYFEKAASLNFDVAIFNLGKMHEDGFGTEKNYAKAFSLYEQAAALGNNQAIGSIGRMYDGGLGREQDYIKAFSYYIRAAQNGDPYAQYAVGSYYEQGVGNIAVNLEKAREWYEKSATKNLTASFLALGAMYYDGRGVQQDYLKSGEYYARAAANNDTQAINFLHRAKLACVKNTINKMVTYDIPQCFLAAHTNDPASMHATGLAYYAGRMNLKQDYEKAFSWLLPCAEHGYPSCQIHLAIMYDRGHGTQEDDITAYAWFNVALKSKHLSEEQKTVSTTVSKIIFDSFSEQQKLKAEDKAKEFERDYLLIER